MGAIIAAEGAVQIPGSAPGTTRHETTMDVYEGGSLTITGTMPLPHCPGGANPGGALVARVLHCSENGCDTAKPRPGGLMISRDQAGNLHTSVLGWPGSGLISHDVIKTGDVRSGTCTACSEAITFTAQITGARIVGEAEWELGCAGPGCKYSFDVTRTGP